MANFEVRNRTSQKVTLVNGARYTHVLSFTQNQSVSRYSDKKVDNFRFGINNVDRFAIAAYPACDKECGTTRDESVTANFIVAAGQNEAYYTRKAAMLKEVAAVLTQAAADVRKLGVGGELSQSVAIQATA